MSNALEKLIRQLKTKHSAFTNIYSNNTFAAIGPIKQSSLGETNDPKPKYLIFLSWLVDEVP